MRKALLGAAVVMGLAAGSAQASTYNYTGAYYTQVWGLYTTSMRVTGTLETGAPIGADYTGGFPVLSYSFFDGLQTLTQDNSFVVGTNHLTTDGSGNFLTWIFQPFTTAPGVQSSIAINSLFDMVFDIPLDGSNAISDRPGTWEIETSPVPLPAALPLLAAGVSAMGFMGWHRRRKALALGVAVSTLG